MLVYLELALIVISITLIGLVLMQTKGTGLGSIFGGDDLTVSAVAQGRDAAESIHRSLTQG